MNNMMMYLIKKVEKRKFKKEILKNKKIFNQQFNKIRF